MDVSTTVATYPHDSTFVQRTQHQPATYLLLVTYVLQCYLLLQQY